MKKLNLLFTALLLWCCLTATAHDFVAGGIYYNITDATNKTVEVTSGTNKYTGSVVIPESVTYNSSTYSVASIGYQAFDWCTALTGIEIPNSVTSIGNQAFNWCTALTGIEIPNSVTSIGSSAFNCCTALTGIEIPNSVTSIGDYAFSDCYGLTSIEIPNSVTSIGSSAFSDCTGLTNIIVESGNTKYDSRENCNAIIETATNTLVIGCKNTIIPNSVTSIGEYAFYRCTTLTSVVIPNSVASIESYAFSVCSNLTNIIVESGNTKYDSRENCNAIVETATNTLVVGCKNTIIPNSVTSIGNEAFYGCTGLTSIVIPNSVTSIGNEAFCGCRGLTSIVIPNSVTSIGNEAFSSCGLTSIVIPNSVTNIGGGAFYGCSGLTSVEIGNSVTSIGESAFAYCYGLKSVEIGNSVTSIGFWSFGKCTGLTSIVIPNSVTSIGDFAFGSCTGLTSIEIGNSVTSIGNEAFGNCPGLKTVYNFSNLTLSKGSSDYGDVAYYANNVYNAPNGSKEGDFIFGKPNDANTLLYYLGNAAELTLPADYNGENYAIDANVFKGNTTITSVVIPNSVTSIGERAFSSCTGLTSIIVESGNAKYDSRENCNAIIETESKTLIVGCKNTIIPNGVKSIGHDAFYGCSGLTRITIPNSVTSIGDYAFYGCSGLTSIEISKSVTSLGANAFRACRGLTSVVIPNSVTSIGENAFHSCSGVASIVIPNSVTSIGENAFYGTVWYKNQPDGIIYAGKVLYEYKGTMPKNSSITVQKGTWGIAGGAFSGCTGLTSIVIPNSVTSIGDAAFQRCSALKTVINLSSLIFSKGSSDYGYVAYYADKVVNAPGDDVVDDFVFSTVDDNHTLVAYFGDATDVTLPDNYNGENYAIGDEAFVNKNELTNVVIPNSVVGIGDSAFSGCSGLTRVDIVDGVNSIGKSAFAGCGKLEEIYISNTIESIGDNAFADCNNLFEIEIGSKKVVSANENVFSSDAYNNASLYVPVGRKDFYARVSPWSNFIIREMEFTGIDEVFEELKAEGGNRKGKSICYDLNGRVVENPTNGIYIIDGKKCWVSESND